MERSYPYKFTYVHNGMELEINYSARDFVASYDSAFGKLEYFLHMKFMCPKNYTEEMIRNEYCQNIAMGFERTLDFLKANPDFIEKTKSDLSRRLAPMEEELRSLRKKESEMKKLLRQGKIQKSEYVSFREKVEDKDLEIFSARQDFFNTLQNETSVNAAVIRNLIIRE